MKVQAQQLISKARATRKAGDFIKASSLLEMDANYEPDNLPLQLDKAPALFCQRKFRDAANVPPNLYLKHPEHRGMWHDCGTVCTQLAEFSLAEQFLKKCVGTDPSDYDSWKSVCFIVGSSIKHTNTIFYAIQAFPRCPLDPDAQNNLGSVLLAVGSLDDSLISFDTLLKLQPERLDGVFNFATALSLKGGMTDADETVEDVILAREAGCTEMALPHCVGGHPALAADYNLRPLPHMQQRSSVAIGLSDHTLDNSTAIARVALGASIIEKHSTPDRQGGGPDDSFSLEPVELRSLCTNTRTALEALGNVDYGRKSSELGNVQFRRSLYFVKDVRRGELLTADAIRSVRPGYGLPPKHLEQLIGRQLMTDVSYGMPVLQEHVGPAAEQPLTAPHLKCTQGNS